MSPAKSPPPPAISDAEAQVMEVLWRHHPATADEITQALQGSRDWQPTTVKTLLGRLVKKQAVAATADGRRYSYTPLLQREAWLSAHSLALVDRLFGGSLAPLVTHFGSQRRLKAADLQALKQLIKAHERG